MTILRNDFKILNPKNIYTHDFYYQSWYSAIFLKKRPPNDNDDSCCITFQVRKDREDKKYLVLANILSPSRFSSFEVMSRVNNLNKDFTNNTSKELPSAYDQTCVIFPANENEYNTFSAQAERDNIPIQRLFIEQNGIDLEGMMHRAMLIAKHGRFYLCLNPKDLNVLRPIDEAFLQMMIRYPSQDAYAIAYAWAQGLIYAERYLGIFEEVKKVNSIKPKHGFYGVEI